jgi:SAM-dependent methyltransferase
VWRPSRRGRLGGVFDEVIPVLRDPRSTASPLDAHDVGRQGSRIVSARLAVAGDDVGSQVVEGVWHAMGERCPHRTLAQLSNVVPPTPQLYERVWRRRSLSLLSPRRFPIDEELGELVDAVRPATGQVIVDVACSEGLYARTLAAEGASVIAVDHSLPFLRRTRQRADALSRRVSPVRALAQHLPVRDASVDAVVMGGSLNEIGDQAAAIAEMGRVLKPGGSWFCMCLLPATRPVGRAAQMLVRPSGISFPTLDDIEGWCGAAGLEVTSSRADGVVLRLGGIR